MRAETRSYDAEGNETRVTGTFDSVNKQVVTTTKRPGMAVDQVEKSVNGLVLEVTGRDGLTSKKRYDALARLEKEIDPRTGSESVPTTKYAYHYNTVWPSDVTATFSYDSATGENTGIVYNDGTPAVPYAYTRTGQTDSVTDTTGTRDFIYNAPASGGAADTTHKPWQLLGEALDTFYGRRVVFAPSPVTTVTWRTPCRLRFWFKLGSAGSTTEMTFVSSQQARLSASMIDVVR